MSKTSQLILNFPQFSLFHFVSYFWYPYSATEGADSLAASGDEAQLGEDGQIGQGKAEDVKSTCHNSKIKQNW